MAALFAGAEGPVGSPCRFSGDALRYDLSHGRRRFAVSDPCSIHFPQHREYLIAEGHWGARSLVRCLCVCGKPYENFIMFYSGALFALRKIPFVTEDWGLFEPHSKSHRPRTLGAIPARCASTSRPRALWWWCARSDCRRDTCIIGVFGFSPYKLARFHHDWRPPGRICGTLFKEHDCAVVGSKLAR